jgi:hypothetical protein
MDELVILRFVFDAVRGAPGAILFGRYAFRGYVLSGFHARAVGFLLLQFLFKLGCDAAWIVLNGGEIRGPEWYWHTSAASWLAGIIGAGLLWNVYGERGKDGTVPNERGPVARTRAK